MTGPAPRVEDILVDLIAFTTYTRTPNADLLRYVGSYLDGHGVATRIIWAADGERGNLLASIGPADEPGGVVLSGHTDVVPAAAGQWETDPFAAVVRDGRIYGRGAADMKGFIASVLAAVPTLVSTRLARPVHLVLTYDEEIDCAGIRHLLASPEAARLAPSAVVLGEPTGMRPATGHRAHRHLETVVWGRQAHGGYAWQGASAIAVAGALIAYLYDRYSGWRANGLGAALESTFANVGVIAGGDQFNIAAGQCRFDWELRPALGADADALIGAFGRHGRELESFHAARGAPVTIETAVLESYPEYRAPSDSPAVALVHRLSGLGEPAVIGAGTEAPFYEERGFPTVIFGPGNIGQAHQPNEYVELAQLHSCSEFVRALARHLAA